MSSSRARPFTNAVDGGAFALAYCNGVDQIDVQPLSQVLED
jgi:hypothetical protein